MVRKLQQCCVVFNFDDPLADVKSKEVKRSCLNELITALNDTRGLLTEAVCMELVHMVSVTAALFTCFLNKHYHPDGSETICVLHDGRFGPSQ